MNDDPTELATARINRREALSGMFWQRLFRGAYVLFVLLAALFALPQHAYAQTVLPLTEDGKTVYATIRINAKQARMLVDTGSTFTILRPKFATGAEVMTETTASSLDTKSTKMPLVKARIELHQGHVWMLVGVFDVKASSFGDGILGSDFFREFKRIEIDYGSKTLTLWK
jgi:hypothetical protein